MKILQSLTRLVVATVAGIGVSSLLLPPASWAQNTNANSLPSSVNPLQDFDTQQNNDPFSRANDDPYGSIFDLMNRAQLGNIRSLNDYTADQNQSLDAAAAQFRKRQQEQLQGQQPLNRANSVTTPQMSK